MIPNSIMWAIWPIPAVAIIIIALVQSRKKRQKNREWRGVRFHKEAEILMQEAYVFGISILPSFTDSLNDSRRSQKSKLLYFQTAILEEKAARLTKHPLSKGVLYRSAAWCAIHAGEHARAERLAEAGLAVKKVPGEIREELKEALNAAQELPEEPIEALFDENLIWCDGPQLSVLKAKNGDQKYLSIWVDGKAPGDLALCVPVSEKELKEYGWDDDHYNIHTIYKEATRYYTSAYEDFFPDAETYLLKPINKEDIPADWWPGK